MQALAEALTKLQHLQLKFNKEKLEYVAEIILHSSSLMSLDLKWLPEKQPAAGWFAVLYACAPSCSSCTCQHALQVQLRGLLPPDLPAVKSTWRGILQLHPPAVGRVLVVDKAGRPLEEM